MARRTDLSTTGWHARVTGIEWIPQLPTNPERNQTNAHWRHRWSSGLTATQSWCFNYKLAQCKTYTKWTRRTGAPTAISRIRIWTE
jgi:hypothetical protein